MIPAFRPVKATTHQGYCEGLFHGYYDYNGSKFALIESSDGVVNKLDLQFWQLCFLDSAQTEYPGLEKLKQFEHDTSLPSA